MKVKTLTAIEQTTLDNETKREWEIYKASGFDSYISWHQAGKPGFNTQPKPKKYVKCKDIKAGSVVGFNNQGLEIVASKKTTKGYTSYSYWLANPDQDATNSILCSATREFYPDLKSLVKAINEIYCPIKTDELKWW